MTIYREPASTDPHANLLPTLNTGVQTAEPKPSCIFSERFDNGRVPVPVLINSCPVAMQMPPGWASWQAAQFNTLYVDAQNRFANLTIFNNANVHAFCGSLYPWPVMPHEIALNPAFITWNVFARAGCFIGPDYFDDGSGDLAYNGFLASPDALLPNADGQFLFAGNINGAQGSIGDWADRATPTKEYLSAMYQQSFYIWLFMVWDRDAGTTTVFPQISTDGRGWIRPPDGTSVQSVTWKSKPKLFGFGGSVKTSTASQRFTVPRLDYVHIFGSLGPQFVTYSSEGGASYY